MPALDDWVIADADVTQDSSITAMAARALADHPGRLILLGFSMGGIVAVEMARLAPERIAALDSFYNRYKGNALVIDKWFATQAMSNRPDTLVAVQELQKHSDFSLKNPNRVRSLIGVFANNQRAFHAKNGSGYALLTDTLIALDPINPQTAAKLTPPLGRWRRFDETRQALMRAALERLLATPQLSKDVFEQASKSLG